MEQDDDIMKPTFKSGDFAELDMGGTGGMSGMGGLGMGGFGHSHGGHDHFNMNAYKGQGNNSMNPRNKKQQEKPPQKTQEQLKKQAERAAAIKKVDIPEQDRVILVDWAIRGTSQKIRLVLEYINIPYVFKKYTIQMKEQWEKQDLPKIKKVNPLVTSLPYLQDKDKIISDPYAIIVYILHKYNRTQLLGVTIEQKTRLATISSIYDQLYRDFQNLSFGRYEMDDDWDKVKDRYVGEKFKYLLSRISGMIKTNKGNMRLLCGQQLTWVDLAVADLVNVMTILDTRAKDYSSQLQAFTNGIFQIYQLQDYRNSTRYHQRPINGIGALFK